MKKYFSSLLIICSPLLAICQITLPPNGDNQKASVSQWIGPVEINITYHSPDVHAPDGKDRKGHIWGELVPYGLTDQQYGTSRQAPWRAGANENTTISFSHDVKLQGKDIKAGKYGFFLMAAKEGPWTLILSRNADSWGSFFYDPKEDALRVEVTPKDAEYTEWLTYNFEDRMPSSAVGYLQWENKKIPFKIEVPNVAQLHLAVIQNELRSWQGFFWGSWKDAALFCVYNKLNLDTALYFANAAISMPFVGVENFTTLEVKSEVLKAMGKGDEADKVLLKAVNDPTATIMNIHTVARTMLQEGKKEKALELFKLNRQKHPEDNFVTYVGLARGYTAVGDKENAIRNWEMAIKNLPPNQKQSLPVYEAELKKLKEGK